MAIPSLIHFLPHGLRDAAHIPASFLRARILSILTR